MSDRRIRIFCDYSAEPVWGDYGLDDLPISSGLRERMLAWARLYERKDSGVLVKDWDKGPAFSAEGLAIVRALKAELPDWTVVYLDEFALERWFRLDGRRNRRVMETAKARGLGKRGRMRFWERARCRAPRCYFEYEII